MRGGGGGPPEKTRDNDTPTGAVKKAFGAGRFPLRKGARPPRAWVGILVGAGGKLYYAGDRVTNGERKKATADAGVEPKGKRPLIRN